MEQPQLAQYIPVLILFVVAVGFAAGTLILSVLLGQRGKRTRAKDTAYECGHRRRQRAVFREILSRGNVVHPVRHRSCVSLSVGGRLPRHARGSRDTESHSGFDGFVSCDFVCRLSLRAEEKGI
jgi:hypothetical protein